MNSKLKNFLLFIVIFASSIVSAQNLKVLTIGNSFTWSLQTHFQKVVESVDGCSVELEFANFGGCELHRHWKYISDEETSGKKIYQKGTVTLRELLTKKKWDIVTIQQASHLSWQPDSYFPYAKNIVDYVKKYCPNAKIMIQQTWSYRADAPRLSQWSISQEKMFELIKDAYNKAAQTLSLEQIPTGEAVYLARKDIVEKFVPVSKKDLSTYKYPDMPRQAGDIVGKYIWKKQKGEMVLISDTIHLNKYGEYLQACVWFAKLYKKPASEIKYIPQNMSDKQAKAFQKIADEVVK